MDLLNLLLKRKKYRMITLHTINNEPIFVVEVRGLLFWHVVKSFESDDAVYARNCAEELLDTLNEEIL